MEAVACKLCNIVYAHKPEVNIIREKWALLKFQDVHARAIIGRGGVGGAKLHFIAL